MFGCDPRVTARTLTVSVSLDRGTRSSTAFLAGRVGGEMVARYESSA